MRRQRLHVFARLGALLFGLGCQNVAGPSSDPDTLRRLDSDSLTSIVAELKLHLRQDGYRFDRALLADGRDVLSVSLWKLDRLQQLRAVSAAEWENVDRVIEFARGRALERLRRYGEAHAAFERVAASGSVLAAPAFEAATVMARFDASPDAPGGTPELGTAEIQSQVDRWHTLSREFAGTSYQSLALEEAEAWEMLRVGWHERAEGNERAILSCERLIEANRASKLYSRHLLRLGDLYSDLARYVYLRSRTQGRLDVIRYEEHIDRALAAYELAAEDRRSGLRKQARTRIEALLAYHQGNLAYVQ